MSKAEGEGEGQRTMDRGKTEKNDIAVAFEEGVEQAASALATAGGEHSRRTERIRAGLLGLLSFFDEQPSTARLLVIDAMAAGTAVLERRQRALNELIDLLDDELSGRSANTRPSRSSRLMAEGVVGAVFSVIQARMLEPDSGPLVELAPSLMSLIVLPYSGQATGGSELARRAGRRLHATVPPRTDGPAIRVTQRTALVLRAIGASPRSSNREIAAAAGLTDEGQTSKLLRRLHQRGLIENLGLGQAWGEANAWQLTPAGQHVATADGSSSSSALRPASGAKAREAA